MRTDPETILNRLVEHVEVSPAPLTELVTAGRTARGRRRTLVAAVAGVATLSVTLGAVGIVSWAQTGTHAPAQAFDTRNVVQLSAGVGSLEDGTVPERFVELAGAAASLVDDQDGLFAASWYDPTLGKIVLSYASEAGREVAEQSFGAERDLVLVQAPASHRQFMSALRSLTRSGSPVEDAVQELSVAADGSAGIITVTRPLTDAETEELNAQISDLQLPIKVELAEDVLLPGDPFD